MTAQSFGVGHADVGEPRVRIRYRMLRMAALCDFRMLAHGGSVGAATVR